jgi:hypothetical protein
MYAFREEAAGFIDAPIARVFAALDDHGRLSSHMSERSWRMGWSRMETVLDAQQGMAVGAHITMRGRVLGIPLQLEEVVTAREPPFRKQWETVGIPQLLVIGAYRMGFELTPDRAGSSLRVTIEYDVPPGVLGRIFGRAYARWCTRQMVEDARRIGTPDSEVQA